VAIHFHYQGARRKPAHPAELRRWLAQIAARRQRPIAVLTYIFCSDDYLLALNREHLDHDYYTDILTFDLTEPGAPLRADLFISTDRVAENAEEFGVSYVDELHRVMAHGLLHLLGLHDKTPEEAQAMRQAEDEALASRMFDVPRGT